MVGQSKRPNRSVPPPAKVFVVRPLEIGATLHRTLPLAALFAGLAARSQTAPPPQSLPPIADQVTVTATRSSSPLGETAKTVFRLSSHVLHDYPALTLDESLRQHAGFELYRRAPSRIANPTSEGVSLRGLGSTAASRTLVLEDGAPLNDPFGGYIHWSEQPQSTIESVTLVTGGGSDLYGSSALGGVIDIVPVSPAAPFFDLSGMGGSQATSDLSSLASRVFTPLAVLGAGESIHTAGYVVTAPSLAGVVDVPANLRSQSYRTELGRRTFPNQRFFLTGNLLDETRNNGTPVQTNATRLWRYLGGFNTPAQAPVTARGRLFGSDEGYRQSFSAISPTRASETLTRLERVHTQELGGTGDATLQLGPFALVSGADLRDLRASDDETPIANGRANGLQDVSARQRFFGGFGELLASHGGWSGAASLRADRASNLSIVQTTVASAAPTAIPSRVTSPDRTEIVLSPRLGVVRALGSNVTLHASGFRAFRTPTFNELYHTGQVGQEITLPNASLVSERGTGWELGTSIQPNRRLPFALQATYFWTVVNRPVSAVEIAQTATTLTERRENLGQIRSRGVELAVAWRPGRALSANLGYQYADATVTKFSVQPSLVGLWIPQVPRQSFTAQLRSDSPRWGQATVAVRASSQAFDDTANQFPLAAFFQLDASWRRALNRRVTVQVLAQNLTDRRQQVSRTPILTLGTPIFAEAGLQLHLGRQAP